MIIIGSSTVKAKDRKVSVIVKVNNVNVVHEIVRKRKEDFVKLLYGIQVEV